MQSKIVKRLTLALLGLVGITILIPLGRAQKSGAAFSPQIAEKIPKVWPKVWDDEALRSWALPLVGLGEPPTYISADYYYRMPERTIYRSYPIYALGIPRIKRALAESRSRRTVEKTFF